MGIKKEMPSLRLLRVKQKLPPFTFIYP